MTQRYLEAGKIVNTHGVHGEIKIQPWADSAEFLKGFSVFYLDGKPFSVKSSRVHKGCLIALLDGITSPEEAEKLRGLVIHIDREEAKLEPGAYFLQDVIGLRAVDFDSGNVIGTVMEILNYPAGDVFVIHGEREILVPNVPAFVKKVDISGGSVQIHLIEGM